MTELILNRQHYTRLIAEEVPRAVNYLWIATADLKDLHVAQGKRFIPFLGVLAGLVSQGVYVRLMHAKEPGPRFRSDFDKYPELLHSDLFERVLCPRLHTKAVIIDGVNIVQPLLEELDLLWIGQHCGDCQRRSVCPDPIA